MRRKPSIIFLFILVIGLGLGYTFLHSFPRVSVRGTQPIALPWSVRAAVDVKDQSGVVLSQKPGYYVGLGKFLRLFRDKSDYLWLSTLVPFGIHNYLLGTGDSVPFADVEVSRGLGEITYLINDINYSSISTNDLQSRLSVGDTILIEIALPEESNIGTYQGFQSQCTDERCRGYFDLTLDVESNRRMIESKKIIKEIISPDTRLILSKEEDEI